MEATQSIELLDFTLVKTKVPFLTTQHLEVLEETHHKLVMQLGLLNKALLSLEHILFIRLLSLTASLQFSLVKQKKRYFNMTTKLD